jgi:hypothetical protein
MRIILLHVVNIKIKEDSPRMLLIMLFKNASHSGNSEINDNNVDL